MKYISRCRVNKIEGGTKNIIVLFLDNGYYALLINTNNENLVSLIVSGAGALTERVR